MCGLKFGQKPVAQATYSCHFLCASCGNAPVFGDGYEVALAATKLVDRPQCWLVHLKYAVDLTCAY